MSRALMGRKKKKTGNISKEMEVKLSLFSDDMILYKEP